MKIKTLPLIALVVSTHALAQMPAPEALDSPIEITPPPYFLLLKRDAAAIVTAPLQWDKSTWTKVGIGLGAVGALMLADDKIQNEILRHSRGDMFRVADAVEPFGAEYSWLVLAGFYGAGRFLDNPRAAAVAQDGLASSLLAAGLVTPGLKALTERSRPSETLREYEFGYGGGSFPSGHTTQAFALAAVIASHYNSLWIDTLAYGTAGLVGYARIAHRAHFASDVLAGALIGVAVGKFVVRFHGEQRGFTFEPMVTRDGGAGLALRLDLSRLRRPAQFNQGDDDDD